MQSAVGNLSGMRLNEALDWALSKVQGSSKTKLGYGCTVKYFKAAAKK